MIYLVVLVLVAASGYLGSRVGARLEQLRSARRRPTEPPQNLNQDGGDSGAEWVETPIDPTLVMLLATPRGQNPLVLNEPGTAEILAFRRELFVAMLKKRPTRSG